MIDAEKKDYSLHELLVAMKISKSSYFYQESAFKKPDKYTAVRKTLASIFNDNYQCYGYRRLYSEVREAGAVPFRKSHPPAYERRRPSG